MEPTSTAAGGFAISKLMSGVAGLFGGVAIAIFWQPAKLKQHGLLAGGAIIGAMSFGFSYIFGGAVAGLLGMNMSNPDNALAVGAIIGSVAVAVVSFVATWLEKREGKDIAEVVREIRKEVKGGE